MLDNQIDLDRSQFTPRHFPFSETPRLENHSGLAANPLTIGFPLCGNDYRITVICQMVVEPKKARRAGGDGEADVVRSVARAFEILDCLHADRPALNLVEIAKQAGYPVSTAQRLIGTLTSIGILRRREDGRYTYGTELMRISVQALESQQLYDLVQAPMERLVEETGETTYFAIPNEARKALYLRMVASPHAMHHAGWLGRTVPGEGTAVGSALFKPAPEAGYFATRSTVEAETTAISAPIAGPGGQVVGAISVIGPTFRVSDADIERFGTLVAREARGVSRQIGGK